jgi:tRNA 2-thiocytidine biosynthesis protein TtcA
LHPPGDVLEPPRLNPGTAMNHAASTPSSMERRLLREVMRANKQWHLIEPDDRVMVCLSGGKDSYALLALLQKLQTIVPFRFSLIAVNLDQGHPGFPQHMIAEHCDAVGVEHKMLSVDTYSIVLEKTPEGKAYCSMCSRLRRGILYNAAVELGCTKIALGHHRDDLIETALLNLFYAGKLGSMPPRLQSDDGRNTVIRPLAFCAEDDVAAYAGEMKFPIVPCNLCGSQDGLHRQKIKLLLSELEAHNPKIKGNMLAALGNIQVSHLLDLDLRRAVGESPTWDPYLDPAPPVAQVSKSADSTDGE